MDLIELEKQIEETKKNLKKWQKLAEKLKVPDDISEQQTNFFLEKLQKLIELKKETE